MSEPKDIKEVHELLRRIQENQKVDPEEVVYYLKNAVFKKNSHGVWIKREENSKNKDSSLSVIKVDFEKELIALRLKAKK